MNNDVRGRLFNVPFYPYDDISYHSEETNKNGIRCVMIIPNGYVMTTYTKRSFTDIFTQLGVDKTQCTLDDIFSEDINYRSSGEQKTITAIYVSYGDEKRRQCCVEYDGRGLIFANACILTGEDFSDLTMDQCYGLVMSARAKRRASGDTSVAVNITDNFDSVVRLVLEDEE